MRRDPPAAGKDLAQVVEHDHAVAQQAPSLLAKLGFTSRAQVAARAAASQPDSEALSSSCAQAPAA